MHGSSPPRLSLILPIRRTQHPSKPHCGIQAIRYYSRQTRAHDPEKIETGDKTENELPVMLSRKMCQCITCAAPPKGLILN